MIGEPARAEQSLLLAGVPDEEQRALRLHRRAGERLGDLEHRHRARAVVVGAVVDRVAAHRAQRAHRIAVDANGRDTRLHVALLVGREPRAGGILRREPASRVVEMQRVVVHRTGGAQADVIAVGADRDELAAERRIAAPQDRDDVARRRLGLDELRRRRARCAHRAPTAIPSSDPPSRRSAAPRVMYSVVATAGAPAAGRSVIDAVRPCASMPARQLTVRRRPRPQRRRRVASVGASRNCCAPRSRGRRAFPAPAPR